MPWLKLAMSGVLVSVIVPTFNRAYCLGRAIDSVLVQTHSHVEVIIIDDGSTDDTRRLVSERYGCDGRVRYLYQANRGVTEARNQGFAQATGDFVGLLDSDDVWKPWKLQVQLAAMAWCPEVGMTWTDMEAVDPAGTVVDGRYLKKMYHNYRRFTMEQLFPSSYPLLEISPGLSDATAGGKFRVGNIYSQMFMGNLVHTSTVLLRRERLEAVGGFNRSLQTSGEDYDFHLRTCREGLVGFIDLPAIRYQIGMPDALSRPTYKTHVFANCLTTIRLAYERDSRCIGLPRAMIDGRFAEVNARLGEAQLDEGNRAAARESLCRSLRYQLWQPRPIRLLALACLPRWLGDAVRRAYRMGKKAVRAIPLAFARSALRS